MGNQIVSVAVRMPENLSEKQKELLREFDANGFGGEHVDVAGKDQGKLAKFFKRFVSKII